jgi:hypothetical protein
MWGREFSVFTVNGRFTRKPVRSGGLGCQSFTMGMNGMAAKEPMYHATEWCGFLEVCLHNLMDPVDFLGTAVHEMTEHTAEEDLGISYDDAHDQYANPWEEITRAILEEGEWEYGKTPAEWLAMLPDVMAKVAEDPEAENLKMPVAP